MPVSYTHLEAVSTISRSSPNSPRDEAPAAARIPRGVVHWLEQDRVGKWLLTLMTCLLYTSITDASDTLSRGLKLQNLEIPWQRSIRKAQPNPTLSETISAG